MPKGENLKGGKIGLKFGEGQKINKDGAPRKLTSLEGFAKYTPTQIRDIFGLCASMTFEQLKEIASDETKEAIWRTTANFIYAANKDRDYRKMQGIMEQYLGKAPQALTGGKDEEGNDKPISIVSNLSDETLERMMNELSQK